ncbi:pyridoxamine 5'-phosphate oxidase family protein [Shewanella sp. VB17]|uniref:MSMEG_1061 family FMN-dependent PPOX-type flavoprotein n=1 Tax=Shewanella sp. VB17 TaxID=2739432 RepID=UPI001566BAEB|nr:MSMEG_1061 family FMN-dependent PPOX-type flavoprotein [Shewanella sp. VB17]NRD75087.1 pyridoxamine 5'-phosphate oxidase family protein [Shewanella sp. VB17]
MEVLNNIEDVREVVGEPNPVASKKIYSFLNDRMINFISSSPIMMLSTVDSDGFPTISPKGDEAGFVRVSDNNTLLIPELRGNKLAFSLENIVQQNKVALIFLVPGTVESLRVHGTCRLLKGDEICESLASKSHNALLVMEVKVTKAYFHCGKAFLRSKTWQPSTWNDKIKISFGQEIADNIGENSNFAETLDAGVKERYVTDL